MGFNAPKPTKPTKAPKPTKGPKPTKAPKPTRKMEEEMELDVEMNDNVMETVEYIHSQVDSLNVNGANAYSAQRVGILMVLLVMVTVLCLVVLKRCHGACCDKYLDECSEEKKRLLAAA